MHIVVHGVKGKVFDSELVFDPSGNLNAAISLCRVRPKACDSLRVEPLSGCNQFAAALPPLNLHREHRWRGWSTRSHPSGRPDIGEQVRPH